MGDVQDAQDEGDVVGVQGGVDVEGVRDEGDVQDFLQVYLHMVVLRLLHHHKCKNGKIH